NNQKIRGRVRKTLQGGTQLTVTYLLHPHDLLSPRLPKTLTSAPPHLRTSAPPHLLKSQRQPMSATLDLNTDSMFSLINSFLPCIDEQPYIFAKCEIDSEPEVRGWFVRELRAGHIKTITTRIYAHQESSLFSDSTISASAVARALCLQNQWRAAMPESMARFFLGRESKPTQHNEFIYDGPVFRNYAGVGLTLEPSTDHTIFNLTPGGQAIRLGAYGIRGHDELQRIVKFAASAWFSHPQFRQFLMEDLETGRFTDRETYLAESILDAPVSGIGRKIPADFNPSDHSNAAKIVDWHIVEDGFGDAYLSARHIQGHAHIRDGNSLGRSTELVWIDEVEGWARTRSRVYRLLGPKLKS
ncbi:hypothetical protein, partial [Acidocella aquatica]|uniref:hypothetical protein n=1 Tax=Acidocella aquatica TaxID=1922313 RepID=UPI0024E05922